jgi:hypothetical protein
MERVGREEVGRGGKGRGPRHRRGITKRRCGSLLFQVSLQSELVALNQDIERWTNILKEEASACDATTRQIVYQVLRCWCLIALQWL